jgi:hypothetical protein
MAERGHRDEAPTLIKIVADEKGGASIRFLDRRTAVAGDLRLDADNQR